VNIPLDTKCGKCLHTKSCHQFSLGGKIIISSCYKCVNPHTLFENCPKFILDNLTLVELLAKEKNLI